MDCYTSKSVCLVVLYSMFSLYLGAFAAKESVTVNVGEDVILSCTVNFHLLRDAHIAWKLEDIVININEERHSVNVKDKTVYLTVSSVTIDDRGNYTCEVRQSSVSSCELYLSVFAPPTAVVLTDSRNNILRDQEELRQDIDELFSLNCCTGDSGSYPKTQIEWLFPEALATVEIIKTLHFDENNPLITHSCSNITLRANEEHTGWIICASFHEGLRRPLYTSITLDTKGVTLWLFEGEQRNVLLNGSNVYLSLSTPLTLVCQLEECSKNTTLSWYIDNQHISSYGFRYGPIRLENEDRLKSIATFESPTANLKGKFIKCRAVCGFQVKDVTVRLDIQSRPILMMPDRPLIESQPASISCILNDSLKDYVFRWTISDKDVTVNATQRLMKVGGIWMSILSFWPLKEHNEKPISCALGNEPSRYELVQMNILYGALISNTEVWPSKLVDENSDVNITCDVQSNPIHENVVQWERFVNGHSKRWIRIREPTVLLVKSTTWYRWVLQLVNVKKRHVGFYRCTATNGIGRFAESDPVHLQLNEMGICFDNDIEIVENEVTTIRCLIKRRTPLSVIRWLINNEEDVTRNSTTEDIIDDRGRTVTESRLHFHPLRKYNGKPLTCTSAIDEYSGDTIVLNVSYCPDQVAFLKCEPGYDAKETVFTCESEISNPPVDLRLDFGGMDVTTNGHVKKQNRSKYTGYISSVSAKTDLNYIVDSSQNITCCSTTNRCTKICNICVRMGTKHQVSFSPFFAVPITAAFLLAALAMLRFYCLHRQTLRDEVLELPECSSSSRGTKIDNRPLQYQNAGPEYANSSSSSSEAIYEHMKDRTMYVNESDGVTTREKISTMWNTLLGYQTVDTNSSDMGLDGDTYNIQSLFAEVIDDENRTTYTCDVSTFTGLYQKHVSTMYTTEVLQPARCKLTVSEQISKDDSYSVNAALMSNGNIQMKVIVKMFSEADSKFSKSLFFEEIQALETLENHESVARILGLCSTSTPHCIIFEYLDETLHGNLKAMYEVTEQDLNLNGLDKKAQACLKQFSYDVANGLEYLTRKDFTYPRLTCKNIFLDDSKHCRLHDFTLRKLQANNLLGIQEQEDMQIAPEVISFGEYTAKSDVWNYGQLLIKIYTFGGLFLTPHAESMDKFDLSGHLENLLLCPNKMRHLISSCCNSSPSNRPSFKNILEIHA